MGSFLEKRYTVIINGYTESYHNQLKSHYFGHSRNTHVYRIIYIILQIVLLNINKMMYVFDLVWKRMLLSREERADSIDDGKSII